MKHQYLGGVNDYRKYGILRLLLQSGMTLGVCWMLTSNDASSEGGKRSYLDHPDDWRCYDPELYDILRQVPPEPKARDLAIIEQSALFSGARFWSRPLVPDCAERERYWADMLDRMAGVNWLFLDPDNGLEVRSKPWGRRDSIKYVYWREVEAAWEAGHSLLIYQHWRRKERIGQMADLCADLSQHTPESNVGLLCTSNVAFMLAAQPDHGGLVRLAQSCPTSWRAQVAWCRA